MGANTFFDELSQLAMTQSSGGRTHLLFWLLSITLTLAQEYESHMAYRCITKDKCFGMQVWNCAYSIIFTNLVLRGTF